MRFCFPSLVTQTWSHIRKRLDFFLSGVLIFTLIDTFFVSLYLVHVRSTLWLQQIWQDMSLTSFSLSMHASDAWIGIGMIGCVLLTFFMGSSYYFLIATMDAKHGTEKAVQKARRSTIPLFGVYIWSFLRSFLWVPYIGWIPAVILGPRFVFSPVLLLKEGKGVFRSVQDSYVLSSSEWLTIAWQLLLIALPLLMSVSMFLLFLPSILLRCAWISFVPFSFFWLSLGILCFFVTTYARALKA